MIDYDKTSLNKMVNTVDEDEKVVRNIYIPGENQESWFLTEEGLYEVLMQSRKSIAKALDTTVEELFLVNDVSNWIDHTDLSRMVNMVAEEEKLKRTLYVSGQNREIWFLTEEGFYEVLIHSKRSM